MFVLGPVALKLARGGRGRRSNLCEHGLYGRVSERRRLMLCPILWCAPLGLMAAARTVRPLSGEERDHFWDTDGFPDWDWESGSPDNSHPFEWKASDWGEQRLIANADHLRDWFRDWAESQLRRDRFYIYSDAEHAVLSEELDRMKPHAGFAGYSIGELIDVAAAFSSDCDLPDEDFLNKLRAERPSELPRWQLRRLVSILSTHCQPPAPVSGRFRSRLDRKRSSNGRHRFATWTLAIRKVGLKLPPS